MLLRDKPKKRSYRFLRGTRKHRLRTVAMLPSMITLINGILGFIAIGLTAKGPEHYTLAATLIFYAMIADMLDGRVARISNTTSSFGGQLDSMCDEISFGAAPAFLTLNLLLQHHRQLVGPAEAVLGDFFTRFIWVAAIVYLSCATIRLARFNVENEEDETAHMSFSGLPTPAAAGVIAALVMFDQFLLTEYKADILHRVILYILPFVTMGCGLLMVSRIRYPHLFNQLFRGRKPLNYLYFTVFTIGIIVLCGLPLALVLTFGSFALSGPGRWAWRRVRRTKQPPAIAAEENAHHSPTP